MSSPELEHKRDLTLGEVGERGSDTGVKNVLCLKEICKPVTGRCWCWSGLPSVCNLFSAASASLQTVLSTEELQVWLQ